MKKLERSETAEAKLADAEARAIAAETAGIEAAHKLVWAQTECRQWRERYERLAASLMIQE